MPSNLVHAYAQKTGKSIGDIEKQWKEVEKSVRENPKYKGYDEKKVYAIINGIVKKNLGLKESEEFVEKIKILDKLGERLQRKSLEEAVSKDQDMVMKSKDVISHVNQALDVLKGLKKAAGVKGERFKYFSTYLANFLDNGDETNQTGFIPWVSQLESDIASADQGVASVRGGESDEDEVDYAEDGSVDVGTEDDEMDSGVRDESGVSSDEDEFEEATDEDIENYLSEGVDKKGEKVEFDTLPEGLQQALKEFGLKSKIEAVVLQTGEKHSFLKVFLDVDSLPSSMFKKFAESTSAPSWVSSHKDKVVLGFKAPKKKVKKEAPKEEVKKESLTEGLDVGVKKGSLIVESEYSSVEVFKKGDRFVISVGADPSHLSAKLSPDKNQSLLIQKFFNENQIKESVDESVSSGSVIPGVDDLPGSPAGQEYVTINKEDITVAESAVAKAKEALANKNFDEIGNLFSGLKVTVAAKMNTLAERMFKSRKISESDAKFLVDRVEKFIKANKAKAE